ncbi:hypothetical protein GQ607_008927 [Colletotrichum asianum]|uniref:Uncharacterized protein n=1 Tax=Colletotrichum asianum TaxID=702518 RepID=A0A8H3WCS5_9PEZI|nr:hypothetical protein GQ607_008927 [Colletotrichum asianum]
MNVRHRSDEKGKCSPVQPSHHRPRACLKLAPPVGRSSDSRRRLRRYSAQSTPLESPCPVCA